METKTIEQEKFEAYKRDMIRKAWNGIGFAGTTNPEKDFKYFQRIKPFFEREVMLIINTILATAIEKAREEGYRNGFDKAYQNYAPETPNYG